MRPELLLNHSFLEGVAADRAAPGRLRDVLVELGETIARTRRVRGEATLHVHRGLASHDVGANRIFVEWAHEYSRSPKWRDLIQPLIELGSGPFLDQLETDDDPSPEDSEPSCQETPGWLRDLVLGAGHHGLARCRRAWILSFGPCRYLTAREYRFVRADRTAAVDNLRSGPEARAAEEDLAKSRVRSTREVLDEAAAHATRVVVLDSARRSADKWDLDCNPERLFDAIIGLDAYAEALDAGQPRDTAATTYQLRTSVEMSQEKGNTLKRPSVRRTRMFHLPDGTEELFDMHAKPGSRTRVHIYGRREPLDGAGTERTRVYIGHCGNHLPLK